MEEYQIEQNILKSLQKVGTNQQFAALLHRCVKAELRKNRVQSIIASSVCVFKDIFIFRPLEKIKKLLKIGKKSKNVLVDEEMVRRLGFKSCHSSRINDNLSYPYLFLERQRVNFPRIFPSSFHLKTPKLTCSLNTHEFIFCFCSCNKAFHNLQNVIKK